MKAVKLSMLVLLVLAFFPSLVFAGTNLACFETGCNDPAKSRDSGCTAAIHRFCSQDGRGDAGIAQEIGEHVFSVACFAPSRYGDVSLNDLKAIHPSCNDIGKSQHPDCMSAVHRWCTQTSNGGAGIVQEVGSDVFGVACFNPQAYQDVALSDLTAQHPGCSDIGKSQHPDCMAAIHRWCVKNGKGTAGLAQEIGSGVFGIACFNATWYGDVYTAPCLR